MRLAQHPAARATRRPLRGVGLACRSARFSAQWEARGWRLALRSELRPMIFLGSSAMSLTATRSAARGAAPCVGGALVKDSHAVAFAASVWGSLGALSHAPLIVVSLPILAYVDAKHLCMFGELCWVFVLLRWSGVHSDIFRAGIALDKVCCHATAPPTMMHGRMQWAVYARCRCSLCLRPDSLDHASRSQFVKHWCLGAESIAIECRKRQLLGVFPTMGLCGLLDSPMLRSVRATRRWVRRISLWTGACGCHFKYLCEHFVWLDGGWLVKPVLLSLAGSLVLVCLVHGGTPLSLSVRQSPWHPDDSSDKLATIACACGPCAPHVAQPVFYSSGDRPPPPSCGIGALLKSNAFWCKRSGVPGHGS